MTHIKEVVEHIKHPITDTGVITAVAVTFFGWLPDVTALFALIYLLVRLWETDTVQKLRKK